MKLKSSLRLPILVLVGFAVLVLPRLVDYYTDWLWFDQMGYRQVFLRTIANQSLVGVVAFAVTALLLAGNFRLAIRLLDNPYILVGPQGAGVQPVVLDRRQMRVAATVVAGVVAVLVGVFASGQWLTWLRSRYATSFGSADPIFGWDASFYVFYLPWLDVIRSLLLIIVLLSMAGALALYVLSGTVSFEPTRGLSVGRRARMHLSLLAAGLFLLLAAGAYLDIPRMLVTPGGVIHGATYSDVGARLPALRLLLTVSVLSAVLAAFHAFSSRIWPMVVAGGAYVAVAMGGAGYATLVQRLVVAPNEQVKETPYIEHNIRATREAFGLSQVEERELSGDAGLTQEDIANNAGTLKNVRLWDHQPLLDTFGQIQEIRTYYDFVSVDNDRYVINGELRQIMLSARELNSESLPNRTWINERLTFTHGYGLTLGPVNQVTQEGLPVLFIKNLPPESTIDLKVDEPSLYFGELSNDYVLVKTRAKEFHYPRGEDNVYTTYDGNGGVLLGGLFRRLLFSLKFRSFKILLSNDVTAESRILFHRNITDRLNTLAPFILYDNDPYLVIADGRLFWIRDGYTTTGMYPYSTPAARDINYIRNSVKVVVDAYHGTTTYYLADPGDPLAVTLGKIFPGLLHPLEEMPESLRRHLRYPEDIFNLQTAVFSTYHMTNPAVFYNKEDQWEVPTIESEGQSPQMEPYYAMMKLPGESSIEFIQMLPFTPRRKDNLAAWMVARSDGEQYGKLLVFQFPKQKVVFGPRQLVARMNQDQFISPQLTLWNQQGSQVIQGTLLVIPIEESLIYIRPMYLRGTGGRIPELKRVVVAYQNQIVMEETLEQALDRLFGAGASPVTTRVASAGPTAAAEPPAETGPPDFAELATQAREHYDRAVEAQRAGDWSRYGEELRQLGEVLQRITKRQQ